MADTIDQASLVISLFVKHPHEISIDLVHVLPICDILFQMMEHIYYLNIGTSVQRAFQ